MNKKLNNHITGLALGDALGLGVENLNPKEASLHLKIFGLNYALIPGVGVGSDDSDHAIINFLAYKASKGDIKKFQSYLAWYLRFWLLTLPIGIGKTTIIAILKLFLGFSPNKSGVFSGGNGPLMRGGVLAFFMAQDFDKLYEFSQASTKITHFGDEVERANYIICLANAYQIQDLPNKDLMSFLESELAKKQISIPKWFESIEKLALKEFNANAFLNEFNLTNLGATGYVEHTLPAVLYLFLTAKNFDDAMRNSIKLGGDIDTVAAILGGLYCGSQEDIDFPKRLKSTLLDSSRLILKFGFLQNLVGFYFLTLIKNLVAIPFVFLALTKNILIKLISFLL